MSVSISTEMERGVTAIAYQRTADGCYRFSMDCTKTYNYYSSTTSGYPMIQLSINNAASRYEEGYTQTQDIGVSITIWNEVPGLIYGAAVEGNHASCFQLLRYWPVSDPLTLGKGFYSYSAVRPYAGLAPGQYAASYRLFYNGTSESFPFTATVTAARPTFSLAAGTYIGPQQVSLSTITRGAAIRYTTDGSDPTANSTLYEGPITITESTTVKAVACMDDAALNSNIVSAAYTVIPPSYTLELTAPQFDRETEGYDQPEAKPLTIESHGNSDAAISSVGFLEGEEYFLLNKTYGATVAAGSTDNTTYTVRPAAGLKPGSYRAIVAVTYNDGKTEAAELSFTVVERRYRVSVYVPEEYRDLGGVTVIGPDTARAGDRVSFMAWMNPDFYDDYQLTEVIVRDTSGNRVEVDYWDGFVMPADLVWLTPVFEPLLPITIELGDYVDLMGIQTDSHGWGWDNAKAAAGETVKMEPMVCDGEYALASVIVTAEDGSDVPCEHYSEYLADEDGIHTETGWRFVMPGQPVTVSFVLVPVFDEADFVLPAGLEIIAVNAFEGDTSIRAVDAGGCIFIGAEAFKDCMNLSRLRLPQNCQIDPSAFSGCGAVYVYAPSGGTTENSCVRIANCIFIAEDTDSPLQ